LADDVGFVLFGLTGGLASGKSSVAAHWRSRGLTIIDADEVAREVIAPGTEGLGDIIKTFGTEVLGPDGSLDRKRLAALVFEDADARRKLEAITHPRIVLATLERASDLRAQNERLACYEASLIVERGLADTFRPLVVVVSNETDQIARATLRDKLSREEARARLAAQLPPKEKLAVANHVIHNDGDLRALYQKADEVLDAICTDLVIDPARYPRP